MRKSRRIEPQRTVASVRRPGAGVLELDNAEGTVTYVPGFLKTQEADELFHDTVDAEGWQCTPITFFGKQVLQPRETAFYGTAPYSYSDEKRDPIDWHAQPPASTTLFHLKLKIERFLRLPDGYFNVTLCNKYEHGKKYMGYHADDEASLGQSPIIASISVGAERRFLLRHKHAGGQTEPPRPRIEYTLAHGSLLVMSGRTQEFYKHSLPVQKAVTKTRLNFTFRHVVQDKELEKISTQWKPVIDLPVCGEDDDAMHDKKSS